MLCECFFTIKWAALTRTTHVVFLLHRIKCESFVFSLFRFLRFFSHSLYVALISIFLSPSLFIFIFCFSTNKRSSPKNSQQPSRLLSTPNRLSNICFPSGFSRPKVIFVNGIGKELRREGTRHFEENFIYFIFLSGPATK